MEYLVKRQKQFLFILVALVLVLCVQNIGFARGASKIYWTEWTSIRRANLDGSNVENVILDLAFPDSITLDFQNNKLFWIEDDVAEFKNVKLGYRKIMTANADGSNVEEIIGGYTIPPEGGGIVKECRAGVCFKAWITPEGQDKVEIDPELLFHPLCLAVDSNREHIYWYDQAYKRIQRANLDGTSVKDILSKVSLSARDIKLDLEREKLYWVRTVNRTIRRMNLDGTEVEDVILRWNTTILSIDLDLEARQIYWTSTNRGIIHRASFNGNNIEEVVTDLKDPENIIVDTHANKLYWSSWDRKANLYKIQQANLDGSDVTDVVTDLRRVSGLALDTEGIYAVSPAGKLPTVWGALKRSR